MKRRLLSLALLAAVALTTAACWDDVDRIAQDPNCVHIDFTESTRVAAPNEPLDGVYCRRD